MQLLGESGTRHHLGVKALGRDEQDREVSGKGRRNVGIAYQLRLHAQEIGQRLARHVGRRCVGAFQRVLELLPLFERKLGVHRQPARPAVVTATRQPNGELHTLVAVGNGFDVGAVLLRGEDFGEQRRELDLAPHAARLDVGKDALQVADADRQRLHLAQATMHLLQPVRDDLERFAQTLLERGLQLFVDRRAHLLQLGGVVGAQGIEALLDGEANGVQPLLVRQRELGQLLSESLQLALLQPGHVRELRLRRFAELADGPAHLVAQPCGGGGLLGARVGQVLPDIRFDVRDLRAQRLAARTRVGGFAGGVRAPLRRAFRPAQRLSAARRRPAPAGRRAAGEG